LKSVLVLVRFFVVVVLVKERLRSKGKSSVGGRFKVIVAL